MEEMPPSPHPKLLEEWQSLGPFNDEEKAALEKAATILGDRAHHSRRTTPQAPSSGDATTINTPQSSSTGPTGLHSAGIHSNGRRTSTVPDQLDYFSEYSPNGYNVLTGFPENADAGGRAAEDFLGDLALGNPDGQLAEQSSAAQLQQEIAGPLPAEDFLHSLFPDGHNFGGPSSQLSTFINDANASCLSELLGSETNEPSYQYSTSQAAARLTQNASQYAQSWEQQILDQNFGGPLANGQQHNDYIGDFSTSLLFPDISNDPRFQFPSQLPTTCSFHIPEESQLTMGTPIDRSLNIELTYNVIDDGEMSQTIPPTPSRSEERSMNASQDVHPQAENMQRPQTTRFSSGPIRTRDAQKAQRGNYKNFNKSGPLTQNQRPKTRGAFTDPMKRKETSETRKRGACLRCRMQRIRVRSLKFMVTS